MWSNVAHDGMLSGSRFDVASVPLHFLLSLTVSGFGPNPYHRLFLVQSHVCLFASWGVHLSPSCTTCPHWLEDFSGNHRTYVLPVSVIVSQTVWLQ
jgi:hypothetical protein